MKKIGIILLGLFLALSINAQSLSDSQVTQIAAKMYSKGKSEMDIAKELLAQGATMEQLQKLRKQLSEGKSLQKSAKETKSTSEYDDNFGREDNSEERDTALINRLIKEQAKPKKQVFGHDIFSKKGTKMSPNTNQATPKNYTLGPGDEVIIDIFGASQVQWTETISPDGKITIDEFGPVQLGGLTIMDATRRLKNTVGQRYQSSQLTLSVGQTRSISVNVMGEVLVPGNYQLSAFATPMNALYMAGGITEIGTLRSIKIYRNNQQLANVDLYTYLMDGKMDGNIRLEDGDVVLVGAYEELVSIEGRVKRPMFYEMQKGETLDKLLYYAGGFSGEAYTSGVRLIRNNGSRGVHTVQNDNFATFALMDGDKVQVDSIINRVDNTISIYGAIFRPGQFGKSENLNTIRQLVEMAGGVTEDAFTKRAVLYRMKLDRTRQAVSIDLEGILNGNVADIELRNEDQLFVPSQQEKLNKQYVVVHGEVFRPDTFYYAEHESVEDLILRAGGLTEMASTSKVDISRRIINSGAEEESSIKTEVFTVRLKDNLEVGENGFLLEPFDEVYVRQSPAYGKQMNVQVRGEILFDGTYAMQTQDDRLSDLIKRAGGLSSHAYAQGARLLRRMTEEERIRREQLIKINNAASDRESVNMEKLDLGDTYYVGIDLQAALKNPGSNEDIVLREGDILMIPSMNSTVKINGEVCFPNTVSYIGGKRAYYYIKQAGGYSHRARRCKTYIIYANGKVGTRYQKVQPGCEIVVPGKSERKNSDAAQWVAISSASASMASVIATLTTVIINATKK